MTSDKIFMVLSLLAYGLITYYAILALVAMNKEKDDATMLEEDNENE